MPESASTPRNAIVIVVDRLGSGFLGPYGNTWIDTPAMNQLASESVLFENMIADSNDLASVYRSYWSGIHAMCRADDGKSSLAKLVERAGYHATLMTDDQELVQHPLSEDFGHNVSLDQDQPTEPAETIEETRFGQLTLAAIEWLTETSEGKLAEPGLLWLHARAMNGPWDAPIGLAERFRDEDDPSPYDGITAPTTKLERNHDPDDVLSVMHSYAAQVSVVDACLGSLIDAIDRHELAGNTLLLLTSPRGYPLGEHGYIGPSDHDLFGETLHVPLLLRLPDRAAACARLGTLVEPSDISTTLASWFGLSDAQHSRTGNDLVEITANESAWQREIVFASTKNQQAARTEAWSFHRNASGGDSLFAKPDDRWEANEVADRCGTVPQLLASAIDDFDTAVNMGKRVELEPLPRELVDGID